MKSKNYARELKEYEKGNYVPNSGNKTKFLQDVNEKLEGKTGYKIVECGVRYGGATTFFGYLCERDGGHLYGIDIDDCSDVIETDSWTFIESDDRDVDNIILANQELRSGIDLLYVDSLHHFRHVEKVVEKWYPYLKEGAYIYFDDVDDMRRSMKSAYEFRMIRRWVKWFFHANYKDLELTIMYGNTGKARIKKLSPLGTKPNKARRHPSYFRSFLSIIVAVCKRVKRGHIFVS